MSRRGLTAAAVTAGALLLLPRAAAAQDDTDEAAPTAPAAPTPAPVTPAPAAAPAPVAAPAVPVVHAGTVNTEHVDTVVVAQPGSRVDLHPERSDDDGPRFARDPMRTAALIAAPIVWGIGGTVFGLAHLADQSQSCSTTMASSGSSQTTCTRNSGVASLVLYDATMTFVPSIPRWVAGDTTGALGYTAARAASVLVGTLVDYGNGPDAWLGPFALGFMVPVALGIVDLATTPHREDLQPPRKAHDAKSGPQLLGIAPSPVEDAHHHPAGATLQVSAAF